MNYDEQANHASVGTSEDGNILVQLYKDGNYTLYEIHPDGYISYSMRFKNGHKEFGELKRRALGKTEEKKWWQFWRK